MIKIICVGKIKEKSMRDLIEEYYKRITKYSKIELIELLDENKGEDTKNMKLESEKIFNVINDTDFVITLEIEGKQITSADFSEKLDELLMNNKNLVFVIGGSCGLDESVKNRSNMTLSFSKMTFPHQLFRVILLEQIYRAFKILNNEKYHK